MATIVTTMTAAPVAPPPPPLPGNAIFTIDAIKKYMCTTLYPAELLWSLFTYNGRYAHLREFGFFVGPEGNIMARHLTFGTAKEFRDAILARKPVRIEVGAIYKCQPVPGLISPKVEARETVIDIDIDDYDLVRTCCKGKANFCRSCWPLVIAGAQIVSLRLQMLTAQSNEFAWVFSGRRGLHCFSFCKNHFLRDANQCNTTTVRDRIIGDVIADVDAAASKCRLPYGSQLLKIALDPFFTDWYIWRHPKPALEYILTYLQHSRTSNATVPGPDLIRIVELEAAVCECLAGPVDRVAAMMYTERRKRANSGSAVAANNDVTIKDPSVNQTDDNVIQVERLIETLVAEVQRALAINLADWSHTAAAAIARAALACVGARIDKNVCGKSDHLLRLPMDVHADTGMMGMFLTTGAGVETDSFRAFYPQRFVTVPGIMHVNGAISMVPDEIYKGALNRMHEWIRLLNDTMHM